MKNTNIEVEGGEILIQSKEGHYAIIPAKHRQEVMDMVKDGCDDCVNAYIQTLPKDSDYAEDGSLLPDWDKVKAEGKGTTIVIVFTNSHMIQSFDLTANGTKEKNDVIGTIYM